jgi:hypothetical protein
MRSPVAGLLIAEARHEVAPARLHRGPKAVDVGSAASQRRNRAVRPRWRAFSLAARSAVEARSMPLASRPRPADMSTCSPVPQPTSNTRPWMAPVSARATNAGWGRPMSQGGRLEYRSSGPRELVEQGRG